MEARRIAETRCFADNLDGAVAMSDRRVISLNQRRLNDGAQ
ncbi:Uncharacterised protein [Mycobacteroides abscessus subsp. abscessus]|nr:hypothetical protein L839_0580 [Mycobacterium avium MAV_120809_2495]SII92695.1 Uncharacterised protein [Mycobacteroides abscessus subsp. abscessus]SIK06651.1 Uncharacterised protein [Mycobacteroides abscessus subsp. abscessus]SIL47728.1 Uncharacterised protein [Mycobacteroides abscessus subsp. abscessus]SLE37353.1 Uncharacterised protein [Mycobacteroides abscessus subsp. abscessus]